MSSGYELVASGGAYDHQLSNDESEEGLIHSPDSVEHEPERNTPSSDEGHIVFSRVSKHYSSSNGPIHALKDIDLIIKRGEIFGIIGRSGAGKSSLIRTINKLEPINAGRIEINRINIQRLKGNELVRLRQRIGMIFQHFNLLRSKTVFENLALPARAAGLGKEEIKRRADRLLQLVGLEGKEKVYPARLSGGQKQRVGIARALMLDPDILLCDEATSALDPETTHTILGLLRDINRQLGLTVVLITHEMSVIRDVCDRVAVLEHGDLVESGPVWKVFGTPQHVVTRALLAPLRVKLPPDLQEQLVAQKDEHHMTLVVQISVGSEKGGVDALDINAVAEALGPDAGLLHGSIERLQGHVQGRLLFGLKQVDAAQARQRISTKLSTLDVRAEVLGYV